MEVGIEEFVVKEAREDYQQWLVHIIWRGKIYYSLINLFKCQWFSMVFYVCCQFLDAVVGSNVRDMQIESARLHLADIFKNVKRVHSDFIRQTGMDIYCLCRNSKNLGYHRTAAGFHL